MKSFDSLESEVRIYCRDFPAVFSKAIGSKLTDEEGKEYIDFFSGAGTLNYGHNNPRIKRRVIEYLETDAVIHSLDMATTAKREFLERFNSVILRPRSLNYKIQFCGPTGANAVEAALKLARKVTGRQTIVFFTNAYHGLSLGSLAVTGSRSKRAAAGLPLLNTIPMAFDGDLGPEVDTLDYFECFLENAGSGIEIPAAVIVETVQCEGGVKIARFEWLRRLESLARRHGFLLIVDDIQVGCGRTGPFFSFEPAGISPDIVCLSKSISGIGLPMAILLIKPEYDVWRPGEHTGTFRGNNLAFVSATEALTYWEDDQFSNSIEKKSRHARGLLDAIVRDFEARGFVRGRGLVHGLGFGVKGLAKEVSRLAFERGLIVECAGPEDEVLKLMPPLTITEEEMEDGITRIRESLELAFNEARAEKPALSVA